MLSTEVTNVENIQTEYLHDNLSIDNWQRQK